MENFENLELRIAKPKLAEDKTMVITGNFDEMAEGIKAVVERYKDVVLTDENVAYVKTLKSHFTSLRTGIERERKDFKKLYITPASKTIDAMCDELQKLVNEGESALSVQLEAFDQKRKDELTLVLNGYVEDAVARFNLRPEFACKIELKDKYYNKTQNEEDSIDDIENQAAELQKKQTEYDSSIELIKAECEGTTLLPDTYIRQLEWKSAMEVILMIKQDKQKVTVAAPVKEEAVKEEVIERPKVKEEFKERTLWIRYEASKGKLIQEFLINNNIDFEFIKG